MAETDKKLVAVFTLQHNEEYYLPIWTKWYSEDIPNEDIYILAHNSNDNMKKMLKRAEKDKYNVEYLTTDVIFDHDWLNEIVHAKQRELLEKYKYVIFTDCDELIAPKDISLKAFMEQATEPAYRCDGWELVHHEMYDSIGFCKTSISSIPLTYVHGYHTATPEFPINKQIVLYHIHKIDYDKAWQRNQALAQEKWDAFAVEQGLGVQNRISDEEEFKKLFYGHKPYKPVPQEILDRIYS